jgi:hypothetical protein
MENEQSKQDPSFVSEKETDASFSGGAILTNRFTVSLVASGIRIAFLEKYAPEKPAFRTAVTMSVQDGIALYKVLQRMLKNAEEHIDKLTVKS